jgi:hypothetical protein
MKKALKKKEKKKEMKGIGLGLVPGLVTTSSSVPGGQQLQLSLELAESDLFLFVCVIGSLDLSSHSQDKAMSIQSRRQAFIEDLWRRNVPDKTTRLQLKGGQIIVTRRVFQKKSAPVWAFYDCTRCRDIDFVCKKHQFALFGHDGVRHYVDTWTRNSGQEMMLSNLMDSLKVDEEDEEVVKECTNLLCEETGDRADVMDEYMAETRKLFNQFRLRRGEVFYRDTGIHLPICCKFPQSNLYRAYRDYHQHQR